MRRIIAGLIDFYLVVPIIYISFFVIAVGIGAISQRSFSHFFIAYWGYMFVFDYLNKGITIGKKIMKVRVTLNNESLFATLKFAVLHATFIVLGLLIAPICIAIYYFCGFRMPYDRWLGVTIE